MRDIRSRLVKELSVLAAIWPDPPGVKLEEAACFGLRCLLEVAANAFDKEGRKDKAQDDEDVW